MEDLDELVNEGYSSGVSCGLLSLSPSLRTRTNVGEIAAKYKRDSTFYLGWQDGRCAAIALYATSSIMLGGIAYFLFAN